MARIIKKYSNRRLYDTDASRYVNLQQVAGMVRDGLEVEVVDAKTGEDLTRHVLTQIIVDDSRDTEGGPPVEFLRDLIKASDQAQKDFLRWYLGTAAGVYERLQEAWRNQPGLPSLKGQRQLWEKVLDPFGAVRGMAQVLSREDRDAAAVPASRSADVADAASELAELRQRLEELESRLNRST